MHHNVTFTCRNNMCTGCGICEDVCPRHCIDIKETDGELKPKVDEELCLGEKCSRCLKVCPGYGIDLAAEVTALFHDPRIEKDKYIGRYVALHTGYSTNNDIRYHSASGGVVSSFLIFLLEKKIIDGAVVTKFDDDHITPISYIARTREEIIAARSSKYCPVAMNKVGNDIISKDGKYVIVGLPCHIQGFRKRSAVDRKFRERVVGYFSIYCSSNRSYYAQDYLLRHYGVKKDEISYFAYRDHGCLGHLTVETQRKKGESHSRNLARLKIPFAHYYGRLLRSFFKPHRCLTCIDHYGQLADVCFGDIHIKPYSDDTIGVSSWIIRSKFWEDLFILASKDGYIKMDDLDTDTLNHSQAAMLYPKQRRASAVMNMDKISGREVPNYNMILEEPALSDYFCEIICHIQRFIGRHRSLWFIIDLLNRKR